MSNHKKSKLPSTVNQLENRIIRARGLEDAVEGAKLEAKNSGLPALGGGPGDAYRHILISAEITRRKGAGEGAFDSASHEILNQVTGSQTPADLAMDSANNAIGIEIGKKAKTWNDVVRMAREKIAESAKADGDGKDGRALWNKKQSPGWKPNLDNAPITPIEKGEEEFRHKQPDESRNPIEGEIGGTGDQKPTPSPSESDPVDPSDSGTDAGGDDLENASPETRKFMKDLLQPGNTVDEIMLKRPEDLTEGEVRQIMIARMDATTEDERERLFKAEKGFFDHFFGNEPAGTDAVGRTMEPKPIRPIPETPKPIATADGEPLEIGLRRIGRGVVRDARGDGLASVIKRLQGGLNLLSQAKAPKDGAAPLEQLKQDGVFGPKSRFGLRRAVTAFGVPKVEEGLALGGFGEFVRDGRKQGFERLREATEKSFATLFRDPAKPARRPADRVENVTLQETLNDLGRSHLGDDRFTPLKLDGDIGPRTRDSFGLITNALGPERVTKRFGEFLGFF